MSLFHRKHHAHHDEADPRAAESFEVLSGDGTILRYARDDFAELFETDDAAEVQQQVERGWVILDERTDRRGGRGPSPDTDLIPEMSALRTGGMFAYEPGDERTVYTLGFLKEGAVGTPEE